MSIRDELKRIEAYELEVFIKQRGVGAKFFLENSTNNQLFYAKTISNSQVEYDRIINEETGESDCLPHSYDLSSLYKFIIIRITRCYLWQPTKSKVIKPFTYGLDSIGCTLEELKKKQDDVLRAAWT